MNDRKTQLEGRQVIAVVTVSIFISSVVLAQSTAKPPRFETATIKPNRSPEGVISNKFDPELGRWTNVTLRNLVQASYSLKDYQVLGAPNWVNSEKWDIVAKSDGPTSMQQKDEMLRTLLAERFQLKVHRESRQLPIYSLTVVKNGPNFQEAKNDDAPAGLKIGTGLITAHKWDVSTLANVLSAQLNIAVVDHAGLQGIYDFKLEWMPVPNEGNFASRSDAGDPPSVDVSGPTIFTALQEQLGLKLESARGPVEVLVIDSVQRPSEN